jgi:transcriptional regulator with XRE-family HTH domain
MVEEIRMPRSAFPEFGAALRAALAARGITNMAAFARTHEFSPNALSRWIHGSVPERREDRERLAEALGVTFESLLVGAPAPTTGVKSAPGARQHQDLESLLAYARHRFTSAFQEARAQDRRLVVQHLRDQVGILADWARGQLNDASAAGTVSLLRLLQRAPGFAAQSAADQQALLAIIMGRGRRARRRASAGPTAAPPRARPARKTRSAT